MKSRFMMLAVTLVAFFFGLSGPVGAVPAANDNTVLILGPTVFNGVTSLEATTAVAQGFTIEVVDAPTWGAITAEQFATYRAIIFGDPGCFASIPPVPLAAAETNSAVWGPEIDGNVIILGTNPLFHSAVGGDKVTENGIAFAAALADKTGAYISLSCYYAFAAAFPVGPPVAVPVLDPFGSFTVVGQFVPTFSSNNAHILATDFSLGTLTDAILSNWGQSIHEGFVTFDSSFEPLAISVGYTGAGSITFPDGFTGIPYILTFGAFVAVVEPDGDNSVDVFTSADNPNNDNPFDFTYQKVVTAGTVTANCCTFPASREVEGTGRGRSNFYKVRSLDVGSALAASPDPDCEALVALVGTGEVVLRPWQRVFPNPDLPVGVLTREFLYTSTEPAASTARDALEWGVCVIESTVESDGVALTTENAEKLVGYSVDCNENDLEFRPLTAGTSIIPPEVDFPSVRPWSAECDDSRSGRRSSLLVYLLNMRIDTDLNGPKTTVSRVLGDLAKEIEFEADSFTRTCVPAIPTANLNTLLAKLDEAKKAINDAKNDPSGILSTAIPLLDELTLLALDLPFCSTNFKGLATGRAMNATFMACSYLGHPDTFDADKADDNDDCLIAQDILDEILGL